MTGAPSGRRAAASAACATVVVALPVFLLGALQVLVERDLGIGPGAVGLLVFCYFGTSTLVAAPVGRLVQRTGPARGVRTGLALAACSLAGVAALGTSVLLLAAALAVGGASNAVAQLAANQSLATAVRRRRQGMAFAVKQSAVPLATLLAGLAVPGVGLLLGWRWAFGLAAVLALAAAPLVPDDASAAPRHRMTADERPPRALLLLAAGVGAAAGASNAMATFLVAAAVDAGQAAGPAGLLLALGSVAGVAGRLGAGALVDRLPGGHLRLVAVQVAVGALASSLLAVVAAGGPTGVLLGAVPLAFGVGWAWPGVLNYAVVRLHPSAPAAATGLTQTGVFAGGALGPLLFGLLVAASGYAVAWTAAATAQVVGAGLVLGARRLLLRGTAAPVASRR